MAIVKLVVGSVARLKGGGPWLTVTKDKPDAGSKFVGVSWFDGTSLAEQVFPRDALEPDENTMKAAEKAEKEAAAKKEAVAE